MARLKGDDDSKYKGDLCMAECEVCGEEYSYSKRNKSKYCSDKCRRERENENARKSYARKLNGVNDINTILDNHKWTLMYDPSFCYKNGSKFDPLAIPGVKKNPSCNNDAFVDGTIFMKDNRYYLFENKRLKEIDEENYKTRFKKPVGRY